MHLMDLELIKRTSGKVPVIQLIGHVALADVILKFVTSACSYEPSLCLKLIRILGSAEGWYGLKC
jgi:hypothetical protein